MRRRVTLGALLVSAMVLVAAPVGAAAAVVAARVADSYQVSVPVDTSPACPEQSSTDSSTDNSTDDSEWWIDDGTLSPGGPLYAAWDTQGPVTPP